MSAIVRDLFHRVVNGLLALGRVQLVDASGAVYKLQVDFGPQGPEGSLSVADPIRYLQHFGLASLPPAGADVVVLHLKGDRSSGLAIGSNHQQHRPPAGLQQGDSALYDQRGAFVWLGADGPVIDAAGGDVTVQNAANVRVVATTQVTLDAPLVKVTQNLEVDGDVTVPNGSISAEGSIASTGGDLLDSSGKTVSALRDDYNVHTHGGVSSGGKNTTGTSNPA